MTSAQPLRVVLTAPSTVSDPNPVVVEFRSIRKSFGGQVVLPELNLTLREGEFLTLLGPSGCGKTTLLRLLAGFERPDAGHILIDGQSVTALPPHRRPVNTVFQSYALFPHLTVFDNVAFGLKMKNVSGTELHARVIEALQLVQLAEHAGRRPHQLSGGQQQRVALARALVNKPRVLLLDECLSALDSKLRRAMQMELKELQHRLGLTFLFVTHDQEEALSMSDRVAVMRAGVIEQIGTPREVYESPANLFVAQFVGESNILEGVVVDRIDASTIAAEVEGLACRLQTEHPFAAGAKLKVLLRPEDLRLTEWSTTGSEPGLAGHIVEKVYKGMTLDTVIALDNGKRLFASEFFDEADPSFDYAIGERVGVSWVPNWEVVLPADEGN